MLLKNPSGKTALLKYGFLAPLLFIMLLVSSFTVVKDENLKNIVKEAKIIITQNELRTDIKSKVLPDTLKPINVNEKVISDPIEGQPEFPGGIFEMYKFLGENMNYPKEAIESKIEGKVFLKFKILEDGSITDVSIMKGIGYGCDEESIRVIKKMPNWKPAIQDGKAIGVFYNLPIVFKLDNKFGYNNLKNINIEIPATPIDVDILNRKYSEKLIFGDPKLSNSNNNIDFRPTEERLSDLYKFFQEKKNIQGKISLKLDQNSYFYLKGNYGHAKIFLDDKVISPEELNDFDPNKIKYININKSKALLATEDNKNYDGIIQIITK